MSSLIGSSVGILSTPKVSSNSSSGFRMANKKASTKVSRSTAQHAASPTARTRCLDEETFRSEENRSLSSPISNNNNNGSGFNSAGQSTLVPIRHLPCIQPPRDIVVEVYLYLYLILGLLLQNANIYRQNWYLVDYDLVFFSAIVLARAVIWRLILMLGTGLSQSAEYKVWLGKIAEGLAKLLMVSLLGYFGFELVGNYSLPCFLYLTYPLFLYSSLFGFTLDPHQERLRLHHPLTASQPCTADVPSDFPSIAQAHKSPVGDTPALSSSLANSAATATGGHSNNTGETMRRRRHPQEGNSIKSPPESEPSAEHNSDNSKATASNNKTQSAPSDGHMLTSSLLTRTFLPRPSMSRSGVLVVSDGVQGGGFTVGNSHPLVSSSDCVRQEVECLWADFKVRIKQLLFSSVLCAYYTGFIPMQVVKHEQLYFEHFWCWVHTAFIFCTSFLLLSLSLLPAQYCGSLYQSALQLGFWESQANMTTAPHTWSAVSSWPHGSVVRHPKGVFRACGGNATVAIPGDEGHETYYLLFTWALYIPVCCCLISTILLVMQLYCLWRFTDYLQSVTLFATLAFSSFPYYHLACTTVLLFKTALKS